MTSLNLKKTPEDNQKKKCNNWLTKFSHLITAYDFHNYLITLYILYFGYNFVNATDK